MAYLAPIHRPSSIRHAIKLAFLTPNTEELVIAKANRLEIWSFSRRSQDEDPLLVLEYSRSIFGRVTLLEKLRPATSATDHLFIGTDLYNYFTLSWDAERNQFRTEKSYVDIADRTARDNQTGDRIHIDPSSRFMTLECYEGVVNVIPIAHAGKGKRKAVEHEIGELSDPIPVRVPELAVRSSCFLHRRFGGAKQPNPELAILYQDSENNCRIKIRELEFSQSLRPDDEPSSAELEKHKSVTGSIELGASHLIPLPPPIHGMLVVGETSISYVEEWEFHIQDEVPLDEATVFVAWCRIDEQRYALADDYGKLYLLMVNTNAKGEYNSLKIDLLGETSRATTLVYLDGGRIFVGSHQGDSQVIIVRERGLEVLQTFPNIAPILDFTIMDMGNRSSDAPVNEFSSGQARIVTGSGAYKDGSLRSVRAGVGLEDRGDLGCLGAPISSIFGLRSSNVECPMDTLVVSLLTDTRILVFGEDGSVEEAVSFGAFDLTSSTLYAANLPNGRLVQVTSSSILVMDTNSEMLADVWKAPATITAVAADLTTIIVSLSGTQVFVLDVSSTGIKIQAHRHFGSGDQISCIALCLSIPQTCFVGFWAANKLALLSLSTLEVVAEEQVSKENEVAVPRSLTVANVLANQSPTLFVGLADGVVVTYSIESITQPFMSRKSIILGTQQPNFTVLPRADGLHNVFAMCEHPSLIYGSEGRVVYSAVTADNATCVCSFDSFEPYQGAIAIATDENLKIAVVDEEHTSHVQDLFLHETVRRVAYSARLKAFGLGCIRRDLAAGTEMVSSHFKLVDEIAFQPLDSFPLNEDELIEAVIRAPLDVNGEVGVDGFVIGTSYLETLDNSQTKGRILMFEVTQDRKLKMIAEYSTKGACRCLAVCQGYIVAALVKTVVTLHVNQNHGSAVTLRKIASYRTATAPIDICVTGNIIAVTDLMKSLSLVEFQPGTAGMPATLTEIARHFDTLWGTAVAHVAHNTYLQSDAEGNLYVLHHEVNGFDASDRRRMRVISEISLGEMVNRIRCIDVAPSASAVVVPRAFLATVEGSIYVFALVVPGKQDLLIRLQAKMADMVRLPGHVPFARSRGVRTHVRDMSEEGPIRFVDGELIERFLDLDQSLQVEAVKDLDGVDVEDVRSMVESLRRIR